MRPGVDADGPALIALIRRCWAEYPGCILDVDAEAPELRRLASYYAEQGGALWVAGEADGMIATRPVQDGLWEICRVYVCPERHGTGLARRLLARAEGHALDAGAAGFELWTDTRFLRAHRFYEKHGYVRGARRSLHDLAMSEEWRYAKSASAQTG